MSAYLDYAAVGVLRDGPRQAMHDAVDQLGRGASAYESLFDARARARVAFARLLDCDRSEIALVPNTSSGLHLVADGLDWRAGDEVVVFDRDFPANVQPWRRLERRGVRLRWVPMRAGGYELDDVAAAIGPATRLVAVSQVNFLTGFRIDLDAVCSLAAEAGALVCVDAVQSLGAFPLSTAGTPVDFVAAGAHKWLCAPPGTGVFYCRRKRLDDLRWAPSGWFGYEGAARLLSDGEGHFGYDLPIRPGANRFEGGMADLVGFAGLAETLGELESVGIDAVSARVRELAGRLRDGLRELGCVVLGPDGESTRSGIVTFVHPRVPSEELHRGLTAAGCRLSHPDGKLRAAPHYWTSTDQVRKFLDDAGVLTGTY